MDKTMKGMLMILAILYVISPLDACPGPIDDILLIMFALASQKKKVAD